MFKEKIRSVDWQRVADWCGRFFWKYLVLAIILWLVFIMVIVSFEPWDETIRQAVLVFTWQLITLFYAALIALGLIGLVLSLFYIIQFKYQYSKTVQFQNFVVIFTLSFLVYIAISASKQHALSTYQWQFIGTSKAIFEQLNANRQSTQVADAQIKQLIEKYNSSNNTLKVTHIITHPAHIYSTTSDREGLGNPVVQFQLRHHTDGTLFWQCQVVRAGRIAPSKFAWCV